MLIQQLQCCINYKLLFTSSSAVSAITERPWCMVG